MKKLSTLCLLLLASISMMAAAGEKSGIYLRGSFNAWGTTTEFLTTAEDGVYEITDLKLSNGADGFKVADANWGTINLGGSGTIKLGTAYTLTKGGGNIKFPTSDEYNCTSIKFDKNKSTLTIEGDIAGAATFPAIETINVAGTFNTWNAAKDAMELKGDHYELAYTGLAAGDYEFKFALNGAWGYSWGLDGAISANVETDLKLGGGNIKLTIADDDTDIIISFWVDAATFDAKCKVTIGAGQESGLIPTETTYVIAGSKELCGYGWDPVDVLGTNHMTKQADGTWAITYTDVPEGTYQFKVSDASTCTEVPNEDGTSYYAWGKAWGEGDSNCWIVLTKTANVTITFDPEMEAINITADPADALGERTFDLKTVHIVGTMNTWGFVDKYKMDIDGLVASKTVTLAAGEYTFKFAANGGWDDNWGYWNDETSVPAADGQDAYTPMTLGETVDAHYNGTNMYLNLDAEKAITFTLDLTEFDVETYFGGKITIAEGAAEEGLKGDSNNDGNVTMADANLVVNAYTTGDSSAIASIKNADVTNDGDITMADANGIVNIYVGQ